MGFKLVRVGSSETRKLAIVGFKKHGKKRHQKSPNIRSNMVQKEDPKKCFFIVIFKVPIPAWSPGRARGGSQAQKHLKMEAWTWIFCSLRTLLSPSLETLWKYFVCSMNNELIVLDVKFTVVFA